MSFIAPDRLRKPAPWGLVPGLTEAPHLWRDARAVYAWPVRDRAFDLSPYKNHASSIGTQDELRGTPRGLGWQISEPSLNYLQAADSSSLDITGAMTIAVVAIKDEASTQNAGLVAKYAGGGSFSNQRSYGVFTDEQSTTPQQLQWRVGSDGTFANSDAVESGTTAITYGKPFTAVCTYRPSVSLRMNFDGVVTTNTTGIAASIHSGTAPLWIGHQFADTGTGANEFTWDGVILFVGVFARAWSALEEQQFIRDPFAMIRERRRVCGRVPAAGGVSIPVLSMHYRKLRAA